MITWPESVSANLLVRKSLQEVFDEAVNATGGEFASQFVLVLLPRVELNEMDRDHREILCRRAQLAEKMWRKPSINPVHRQVRSWMFVWFIHLIPNRLRQCKSSLHLHRFSREQDVFCSVKSAMCKQGVIATPTKGRGVPGGGSYRRVSKFLYPRNLVFNQSLIFSLLLFCKNGYFVKNAIIQKIAIFTGEIIISLVWWMLCLVKLCFTFILRKLVIIWNIYIYLKKCVFWLKNIFIFDLWKLIIFLEIKKLKKIDFLMIKIFFF